MDRTRRDLNVAIWAYVIMPEHVHLVIRPRQARYKMGRILACLKRSVSDSARDYLRDERNVRWLRRLTVEYPSRRVFRFWQPGGGYDHNIFREKTVQSIVEYVHANPVRRGLVDHPAQWEWSSARFWEGQRDVPILMDVPDV